MTQHVAGQDTIRTVSYFDASPYFVVTSASGSQAYCSGSKDPILLCQIGAGRKTLHIKMNYEGCNSIDSYTLGGCPPVQWTGPDIVEVITVDDSSTHGAPGEYPLCNICLKVRPTQSATYTVRWENVVYRSGTQCTPPSVDRQIIQGTYHINIRSTPNPPTLVAQTLVHPSQGEIVEIIAKGSDGLAVDWNHRPGELLGNKIQVVDPYECRDYKARYFDLYGSQCFSEYSNTINAGKLYSPTNSPGFSSAYGNHLNQQVGKSVGRPEYAYRKQFACIQQRAAAEYNGSPTHGWAGGFVKDLFDRMATKNPCEATVDDECGQFYLFPGKPFDRCFTKTGIDHVVNELVPGFFAYAANGAHDLQQWDSDHELFLAKAVSPCFDDLYNDPSYLKGNELWDKFFIKSSKLFTITIAQSIRETAQTLQLPIIFTSKAIEYVKTLNGNLPAALPGIRLNLPSALQKADLFLPDIDALSTSNVTINTNQYLIRPNLPYQVTVTPKTSSSGGRRLGTLEYALSVTDDMASISTTGVLTIHRMPLPTVNDRVPIYVFVKDGEQYSIGQFAINDTDQDGDQLNDSFEIGIGLKPTVRNDGLSDSDGDDLLDQYEALLGTNPLLADSDSDSYSDKFELLHNSNPANFNSVPQYVQSVISGSWSSPSTWSCLCVPTATHDVRIKSEHIVTIDTTPVNAGSILLEGKLRYQNGGKVNLNK